MFIQDSHSYFRTQSLRDSPCMVRLAGDDALFSLSKWNSEAYLSFAPGGEHEGKILCSKNEVRLRPRAEPEKQHVFRTIDEGRFEYDLVLLKEPDSNVVEMNLDFPDGLVFYYQPTDRELGGKRRRTPPEVQGSYAVYWKEMHNQYKTGKFCHIYRPLVCDARGRKVWADMRIHGKVMSITIPESWLADAQYPVVVDPIIGSYSVGSQTEIEWYDPGEDNFEPFSLTEKMGLCSYVTGTVPVEGYCKASLYVHGSRTYTVKFRPVLYGNGASIPSKRLSKQEAWNDELYNNTPRWVHSSLFCVPAIQPHTPFWFGFDCQREPLLNFDYGGEMYVAPTFDDEPLPEVISWFFEDYSWPIRISSYLTYGLPQVYTRSLVCSGKFATSGIIRQGFLRRLLQPVLGMTHTIGTTGVFFRLCQTLCSVNEAFFRGMGFIRLCISFAGIKGVAVSALGFVRRLASAFGFHDWLVRRLVLKKEELVFVSRITREIEFKGDLV